MNPIMVLVPEVSSSEMDIPAQLCMLKDTGTEQIDCLKSLQSARIHDGGVFLFSVACILIAAVAIIFILWWRNR